MEKILIVEDECIVAEDLKNTLALLGYQVSKICSSGEKALDFLEQTPEEDLPGLVLMDIFLSGSLTGIQTAEIIREKYRLPVVYITAFMNHDILEKAKLTQPFGYIVKPFQEKELQSTIEIGLYKSKMERKLQKINEILQCVRKIQKILFQEKDSQKMMEQICHILDSSKAFSSSCLALYDGKSQFSKIYFSKDKPFFAPLAKMLQEKQIPPCVEAMALSEEPITIGKKESICLNCPILHSFGLEKGVLLGLKNEKKFYGILATSHRWHELLDREEYHLFKELADDITFALHSMDLEMEKQKALEALAVSEAQYRTLVESSPESILVEQDEKIVYVNPEGLKLSGYSLEEALNLTWDQIFIAPLQQSLLNGKTVLWSGKLRRKDGELREVEISSLKNTFQGRPSIQSIIRDMTKVRDLEEKNQRMQQMAALGEMAATLAHEIRNPLSAVGLGVQRLLCGKILPEQEKAFAHIQKGISRIDNTINGILDFSRPLEPKFKKASFLRVLKRSIQFFEHEFPMKNIKFLEETDHSLPEIEMDPSQIFRVMINLLLNALQAMPEGGRLKVKTTVEGGTWITVQIEDTGHGISEENLSKIYQPFFTTKPNGTGLGLAIVFKTINLHGGKISVESKEGKGTIFTFQLPVEQKRH